MVSILKLFTIIDSNNHEMLSELIKKNKKMIRQSMISKQSGTYILPRAVRVRARECFDLLVDIIDPESFTVVTYNNETNTGLLQALKYYTNFPSQENKYYLEKLLDINTPVAPCEVLYAVDNTELFTRLFNRVNVKVDLILKLIETNNISAIEYALSWLINEGRLEGDMIDKILKSTISYGNLSTLKLLDSKGVSLLVCEGRPSIYCMFNVYCKNKKRVEQFLDYLLDYYRKQPVETIRHIPNINAINNLMISGYWSININNSYRYEIIRTLKSVGIDTIPIDIVNVIYKNILSTNLGSFKYLSYVRMGIVIIYSLLENNMILTNVNKDIIKYLKAEKLVYQPTNYSTYNSIMKETYRGIYYILSHFGTEIDLNDNDIKSIFDNISLEEFSTNKTEFINGLLTELNVNKTVNKTVNKRKSKNITL